MAGPLSDDDALAAYLYGYSIDEAYKYLYETTLSHGVALNEFQHLTSLADDTYTEHPTINNDTLHVMGWLDVGAQPVVVTIPDADAGRYWILHTMDMGHYTNAMIGSRLRGPRGGNFMFALRTWDGEAPGDIDEVVRVESDIVKVMGRIMAIDEPGDLSVARELQAKWRVRTLSDHLGVDGPAPIERSYPDPATTSWLERVNFMLCHGTMADADRMWLDGCAAIGLEPCRTEFTRDQLEAGERGRQLGMAHIEELAPEAVDARKLLGTREQLQEGPREWFCEGTYLGQWGLPPEESMYFQFRTGTDGENINGSGGKRYRIRLAPPNVSEFWSYTVYRSDNRLMAHNAINRHSRGDRTLVAGADGWYTIDLGADADGHRDDPNFLPIPEQDCYLVLRLYGPGDDIIAGDYTPAAVEVLD